MIYPLYSVAEVQVLRMRTSNLSTRTTPAAASSPFIYIGSILASPTACRAHVWADPYGHSLLTVSTRAFNVAQRVPNGCLHARLYSCLCTCLCTCLGGRVPRMRMSNQSTRTTPAAASSPFAQRARAARRRPKMHAAPAAAAACEPRPPIVTDVLS